MTFDEWMKTQNPKHVTSDDTVELRLLRAAWAMSANIEIGKAVNRFLGWKLPLEFFPDGYIYFDRAKANATGGWPIGTNLFSADQASAMFKHVFDKTHSMTEFEAHKAETKQKLGQI